MAAKYQLITELYQRTGAAVSRNPQAWQSFLSSACRNYKCRFDEQLLIFAQRPDATAVTTLETWNRQFKRWVNKDSRGIAVFDTKGRRNTLKYYFDVSDTHEGYYNSRPVPIWQMNERYEQAVIERLSDRFGNLESGDLGEALMQTAKNAVEDNLPDYLAQLKECTKDSFLEELDDFNVEVIYKRLAVNSVAFMLMSRCGLDTGEYFEIEDFSDIINFNTPAEFSSFSCPGTLSVPAQSSFFDKYNIFFDCSCDNFAAFSRCMGCLCSRKQHRNHQCSKHHPVCCFLFSCHKKTLWQNVFYTFNDFKSCEPRCNFIKDHRKSFLP